MAMKEPCMTVHNVAEISSFNLASYPRYNHY